MSRPEAGASFPDQVTPDTAETLPRGWFDYDLAFSRNIGWFSEVEQQRLRNKRIAIAGMGGVGGVHMLTLARLGIGAFNVSDMDRFELGNFNRQVGAMAHTLGQPKVHSVVAMAREINPELDVRIFDHGVNEENLEQFLDGVDVYIDGLDFFVLDIRRKLFARAREKGITCITAGPLGMGTGYIVFTPDGMSFEDYFRLEGKAPEQQYVNFLMGLTPAMMHRRYLTDGSRVDMMGKRGPSTAIACQLCAGVAAVEAVKVMLGRGPVRAAPYYHHFDPYLGRFLVRKLWWGNAGPIQRLKTALVARLAKTLSKGARPREFEPELDTPVLTRILEAARWAPSPDNSQPWRFEIVDDRHVRVHIDLEQGNPYAYRRAEPIWLANGMLLHALRLAASKYGWGMEWTLGGTADAPVVDVMFDPEAHVAPDGLAHMLKIRTVDRGTYRRVPLTPQDKAALENALGPGFAVTWIEPLGARLRLARVNAAATRIRLRSRRCHKIHQDVIDWEHRYSRTGLPAGALGLDPLAQRIMRFVLADWRRMRAAAEWLGAGLYASFEMDIIPSIYSGAFAVIRQSLAQQGALTNRDRLLIGERLMRFWLEATQRGLAFQPSLAAMFCAAQDGATEEDGIEAALRGDAAIVAREYERVTGINPADVIFQARLGVSKASADAPRSIRRLLSDLIDLNVA